MKERAEPCFKLINSKTIISETSQLNNMPKCIIESDILNDGSLDYPDEILALFDIVIASVHSNLKMTETAMEEKDNLSLKNEKSELESRLRNAETDIVSLYHSVSNIVANLNL